MKKVICLLLACALMLSIMVGCGQSDSNAPSSSTDEEALQSSSDISTVSTEGEATTLTGRVTLKEFLDSGPKVGFVAGAYHKSVELDKNNTPLGMYLFEDGKIYYVLSFDENGETTDDWRLTWGEFSKMSDEELVEYARSYRTLHYGKSAERFEFDPNDANANIFSDDSRESVKNVGDVAVVPQRTLNVEGEYIGADYYYDLDTSKPLAPVSVYYGVEIEGGIYAGFYPYQIRLYVDENGNLYFYPSDGDSSTMYPKNIERKFAANEYPYPRNLDENEYDKFDELTPYDGRYGEIEFPAFTYVYNHQCEMPTGDYTLHLISDRSGNQVETEEIIVELSEYGREPEPTPLVYLPNIRSGQTTIYNSAFTLLYRAEDYSYALVFRTDPDLTITLDNIGDEGVEVD